MPSNTDSGDGRSERWRAHRRNRRRELVQAVVEAVRELGPDIGMDDIAAHSGISKQVFYRYFADKFDLRVAVGRSVARALVADVTATFQAQADLPAMLAAGVRRYLQLIETELALYRFVTRAGDRPRGEPTDVIADFETVIGLQVARLVGDRLRASGGDAGAAEPWGFALVGAIRAAADRWLDAPSMSREALADYLTQFTWSGLSVLETGGPADSSADHLPTDRAQIQPLPAVPITGRRRPRAR